MAELVCLCGDLDYEVSGSITQRECGLTQDFLPGMGWDGKGMTLVSMTACLELNQGQLYSHACVNTKETSTYGYQLNAFEMGSDLNARKPN